MINLLELSVINGYTVVVYQTIVFVMLSFKCAQTYFFSYLFITITT